MGCQIDCVVETLAVVFLEDDSVFKKVVQAASGAAAAWTAKGTMSASHGGGAHHHCLWRGEVFARERVLQSSDGAPQMLRGKPGRCPKPCYSPRLAGARR